jgi:hypothetical protein
LDQAKAKVEKRGKPASSKVEVVYIINIELKIEQVL